MILLCELLPQDSGPLHRISPLRMPQWFSFDDLPEEIWNGVIQAYITVEESELCYLLVELLLPLTLVSMMWKQGITDAPLFWTSIVLDELIEDMEMKVAACLFFSKEVPLTLSILGMGGTSWTRVTKAITAHASRIGAIQIVEARSALYHQEFIHNTVIKQIMPLPALKSLFCPTQMACTIDLQPLIRSSPGLTHISGYYLDKDVIAHLPRGWRTITTIEQPDVVLPLLAALPSLRDVSFLELFTSSTVDVTNIQFQDTTFKCADLNWTSLVYEPSTPPFFLPSLRSTLAWFEIHGEMSVILNIFPIYPNFGP
jgi:hypothetical protein